MKPRIQALDGLRFLAAIGVLWIHTWTAHGNPRFFIGKVDIADLLALGGNGVDMFFVISGFCMYYFYASKIDFSYNDFLKFIIKRWVRLSPAFYSATLIYILVNKYIYHQDLNILLNLTHSVFYLDNLLGQYRTASHFWTLTVEFQFYFIIPFILIYQNKIGFKNAFAIFCTVILSVAVGTVCILKTQSDFITSTIVFRGIEFGCGIIVARLLLKHKPISTNRISWLIGFIVITYIGRVLISNPILLLSQSYYSLFKLLGFIFMGGGFAGIVYLSITSVKWLNLILGNKLFKKMGRISYSFYLLHALVFPTVVIYTVKYMPLANSIIAPIFSTVISAILLYPISLLSFNILEKPFLSIGNLNNKNIAIRQQCKPMLNFNNINHR